MNRINGNNPVITIDYELCSYCGSCVSVCPESALLLVDNYLLYEPEKCTMCADCIPSCPVGALDVSSSSERPESSVDIGKNLNNEGAEGLRERNLE